MSIYLFYKNFRTNNDLYWSKNSYIGSLILLFIALYLFTSSFNNDAKSLQIANDLKDNIISSDAFFASWKIFWEAFKSDDMKYYMSLFVRQASIFIPFSLIALDIFSQIKYKRPLMTNMFYIISIILLLEFLPPFILRQNKSFLYLMLQFDNLRNQLSHKYKPSKVEDNRLIKQLHIISTVYRRNRSNGIANCCSTIRISITSSTPRGSISILDVI